MCNVQLCRDTRIGATQPADLGGLTFGQLLEEGGVGLGEGGGVDLVEVG